MGAAVAEMNRGIALLNLQKLPEAEAALQHAATLMPKDPRVQTLIPNPFVAARFRSAHNP